MNRVVYRMRQCLALYALLWVWRCAPKSGDLIDALERLTETLSRDPRNA